MFILSILFIIGFLIIAALLQSAIVRQVDQSVIHLIQNEEQSALTIAMKGFTSLGNYPFVIAISIVVAILLFISKQRNNLLLFTTIIVVTPTLNRLLKVLFQRERPEIHRLVDISGFSFPSGHAMIAVSLYGILTYLLWNVRTSLRTRVLSLSLCSVIILLVGVSRIYLGVHYPSDIIGGYFLSGALLTLFIWIDKRIFV